MDPSNNTYYLVGIMPKDEMFEIIEGKYVVELIQYLNNLNVQGIFSDELFLSLNPPCKKDDSYRFLDHAYYHNIVVPETYHWLWKSSKRKVRKNSRIKWKLREVEARMRTMVEAKLEDPTCECGKLEEPNTPVRGLKVPQQVWHVTVSVRWKLPTLREFRNPEGTTIENWLKFRFICQGVMVSMKHTLVPYYCLVNYKNQREL